MHRNYYKTGLLFAFFLVTINQICTAAISIEEAVGKVAQRLADQQITEGIHSGSWPSEEVFTGSIVAGMARAYELTCNETFRTSAQLGGDYIISIAQGNFLGEEAFALTCLSHVASSPDNNRWRTAVADFYSTVSGSFGGTIGYISAFKSIESSMAVLYMAHHVVAAYYVDAEDKDIWRQHLIDSLSHIDDSCSYPVMALGAATWALAKTGALNETIISASGGGTAYWDRRTLSDLPMLLMGHQVPDGQLGAGSFYWQFGHADNIHGYTEDAIFATLGVSESSQIKYDPELDSAKRAALTALLTGIGDDGKVSEHLFEGGFDYYAYAGEMLSVLSEMVVTNDLDSDGDVDSNDFEVFLSHWNETDCDQSCWCNGADLDKSGEVDEKDLEIIVSLWLDYVGRAVSVTAE